MKVPPRKRKTSYSSLRRMTERLGLPFNVRRGEPLPIGDSDKSDILFARSSSTDQSPNTSALGAKRDFIAEADRMYPTTKIDPDRHGPPCFRTFLNISKSWKLSLEEQMALLAIHDPEVFNDWKALVQAHEAAAIPTEVIERIGRILSIYGSLVTLFPEERTSGWLRAPNTHPIFNGSSALAVMMRGDLKDLRKVASYLLGQIYGGW